MPPDAGLAGNFDKRIELSGKEEFYWSDPVNFDENVLINVSGDKIWKFQTDADFDAPCTPGDKETVLVFPNEKFQAENKFESGFIAPLIRTDVEFLMGIVGWLENIPIKPMPRDDTKHQ